MGLGEGIKVALFVMSLVFALLGVIYALIRIMSLAIARIQKH